MIICRDIHSFLKTKLNNDSKLPKYMAILKVYTNEIFCLNKEKEY